MKKLRLLIALITSSGGLVVCNAQSTSVPLVLNGPVRATAQKGDTIYIAGDFTTVGVSANEGAYGALVDMATGALNTSWPKPNNEIRTAVPDGYGGFYITGIFTAIGNTPRNGIAHINASGTVTSQLENITQNGTITSTVLDGNLLYISGNFTSVGDATNTSIPRNRIAAINVNTGEFTSFSSNFNHYANSMVIKDTTLYAGGLFTQINGLSCMYFAAIFTASGEPGAWKPAFNGAINEVQVSGDTIFAGGEFTTIYGVSQPRFAVFKDTTLLNWNPAPNKAVRTFEVNHNTIFLGGIFDTIAGERRVNIASIDRNTGVLNPWNASAPVTAINSMFLHNNILYAGGTFSNGTIGGLSRRFIAALDINTDTNMTTSWDAKVTGAQVSVIKASGSNLYLGGGFTRVGGVDYSRNRLAAFRASTGELLGWDPNANASITCMYYHKEVNRIYVFGASLTGMNGTTLSKSKLSALDATTGVMIPNWSMTTSGSINTMVSIGDTLYMAGAFTSINGSAGVTKKNIAGFNPDGTFTSFTLTPQSSINTMAVKGDTIYMGGSFSDMNGITSLARLAAIRATTSTLLTSWVHAAQSTVNSIVIKGDTVIVGGVFTNIGGTSNPRGRLAAITTGGARLAFNPNANADVKKMVLSGNGLYIGGTFATIASTSRPSIAAINAHGGALSPWLPVMNSFGEPLTLLSNNGTIYAGSASQPYFLAITEDKALPVTLTSFTANKYHNDVKLTWSTSTEKNNRGFIIEKSTNGFDWNETGFVSGHNNSNRKITYTFNDENAFNIASSVYYRLKQIDFDGQYEYSTIVSVSSSSDKNSIISNLYPNPNNGSFSIDFTNEDDKLIDVYDMHGQLAASFKTKETILNINLSLNKGIYVVKVSSNGSVHTQKLIIN